MPPRTRYVDVGGAYIAYQVVEPRRSGTDLDLVYVTGSTSHVDVRWESPQAAGFLEGLASFSRLIMFDRRGSGASDPSPADAGLTWEMWVDDLRAVLDAVGSERPALIATIDGGPMGLLFAATYPERTRALVLANTSARLRAADDYPAGMSDSEAASFLKLLEMWGTEEFASLVVPTVDDEDRRWFARLQRASMTPRAAVERARTDLALDVRAVLPTVRVPTLVLHARDFSYLGVEHGRYLAENIPGARYVEIDSPDSALIFNAGGQVVGAIEEFLTGSRRPPDPDRMLATVVFTDIVGSTRQAAALGDRGWRRLLERHDAVAAGEVARFGGVVRTSTGDGVMATFDAPGRAIRSALAMREALAELGLEIRAGVHAGEVEVRGDDISGLSVHIAARVLDAAQGGGVLVSRTVADLVAGSGLALVDLGSRALKGVPGEWRLYRVDGT